MIQFYEKKDFGGLISDTLKFFKLYGRNFFKNYLLLNGILLILILVMFVVGFKGIFSQIFVGNLNGETYFFEKYLQENAEVLIIGGIIFFIIFMASMFVVYSYPVLYMKKIADNPHQKITADGLLIDLKKFFKKFIIYILGMMLIMLPFTILFLLVSSVIFIFGFILMIFVMPVLYNVVNFTLFHYYNTNNGFFNSLSYALRSQFSYSNAAHGSPFWKYWGSSLVLYLMITIITYIFTFIPAGILIAIAFTVPNGGIENMNNPADMFNGGFGIALSAIYGISIVASLLLSNLLFVNAGLCYYDSRVDLHRNVKLQEIDSIGQSE